MLDFEYDLGEDPLGDHRVPVWLNSDPHDIMDHECLTMWTLVVWAKNIKETDA